MESFLTMLVLYMLINAPIIITVLFIISLILYLSALKQKKHNPAGYSDKKLRGRMVFFIVTALAAAVYVICLVLNSTLGMYINVIGIPVAVILFFAVSLILYISEKKKINLNKSASDERIKTYKSLLIVSSVILGLIAVFAVLFYFVLFAGLLGM